jgi:anti-sigma factor RsiW
MTRPFPDELLSAFLDDELDPADREQVEQHLAASEADRLLVAELQRLRGEVASLPPAKVSTDFTDRVLAAALAEAERTGMAIGAFDVTQTRGLTEGADSEPVTPSSNGSAASVLPEPGFTGILAAEADTE